MGEAACFLVAERPGMGKSIATCERKRRSTVLSGRVLLPLGPSHFDVMLTTFVFVSVAQTWGLVCDDPALLQFRRSVSATCDINDINAGLCEGWSTCFQCSFDANNSTVPTNAPSFPDGRLLCQGDETTCVMDDSDKIIFKSSGDYLECIGSGCSPWNVEGAGAVCCSGYWACAGASISLAPGPCQNDVCCSGNVACSSDVAKTTFSRVRSLSRLPLCFLSLSGLVVAISKLRM